MNWGIFTVIYLFCIVVIWKASDIGGSTPLWMKIVLTIFMIPIIMVILYIFENK